MKILYINNFFTTYGGAENSIMLISGLMQEKGHEVYYYATDKKPYFEENYRYSKYFPKYGNKRNLSLKSPQNFIKTFYNFEAKNNLKEYLKEIKPDIVSIHNIHFHLTPSVIDACRELEIPMIFYLHDPRSFCPGGTLSYSGKYCHKEHCIKGNPLMCLVNKCKLNSFKGSLISSLYYIYFRNKNIFEKVNAVICPSQAMLDLALRAGVTKYKLHHINHFLSNEALKAKSGTGNQDYFLYVGRVDSEKGINYLIEAMKKLQKEISLHIVGSGAEEDHYKKIANEHNLDNIKFLGYKSGNELEEEYKNCIATILPCNWFEVFGRTIIESFSFSKPVIASDLAGISDIVDDEQNGFLVEPKNIEEICEKMKILLSNKQIAVKMGENGNKKLKLHYNAEVYYEKYHELLKSLI